MKIKVNGKEITLEKELTLEALLDAQKVEMQDYVTVQINDELIPREDFKNRLIQENDIVEFLYFMGGGRI
ncbi:MAG: sulfur carrier protein ThiS [Clostridia bacterium]|nr:sulfur carrier protein ThiS [Clostridia bacterium]